MGKLRGELYGVRIGSNFIPCEMECEISITRDLIDKSGSTHGKWKHARYGYLSWSMSVSCNTFVGLLNSSSQRLIEAQIDGIELEVYISARQSNVQEFEIGGNVLIESQQIAFPNSGFSTHNLTLRGNGALNLSYEEIGLIINAQPYNADKPTIVNTTNW